MRLAHRAAWITRRLAPLVGVALGLAVLLRPSPASACSCSPDARPHLFVGADNRIPARAVGIAFSEPEYADLDLRRFRVEWLDEDGRWIEDTFGLRELAPGLREIVPAELQHNRFRISIRHLRPGRRPTGALPEDHQLPPFETIEEVTRSDRDLDGGAAIELRVEAPTITEVEVADDASCSHRQRASAARIEAVLPRVLEPFRGYLLFETFVDGRRWAPKSDVCGDFPRGRNRLSRAQGPGVDVVYSGCPGDARAGIGPAFGGSRPPGVAPGTHQVQVIVSSPDGHFRLASPRAAIILGCDASAASSDEPAEPAPAPHLPLARGRCSVDDPRSAEAPWALAIVLVVWPRRRSMSPHSRRSPRRSSRRRYSSSPIASRVCSEGSAPMARRAAAIAARMQP